MDKLEYIPGDLVMTNGVPCGTAKDVVYRVTLSDPSKTFELDDGTELKGIVRLENLEGVEFGDKGFLFGDCCAWVNDIVPIPLTSEILEKNGWELDDATWIFKKGNISIFILLDDETYAVYLLGVRVLEFHFVHELQHLLFGLGINHEMEVQA